LGLTNDETSRLLKVPIGTVKSRLHYALRRLRAAYDAEERT
jgi:DNA-directed RNA polymerase specialized sigma24 family protein